MCLSVGHVWQVHLQMLLTIPQFHGNYIVVIKIETEQNREVYEVSSVLCPNHTGDICTVGTNSSYRVLRSFVPTNLRPIMFVKINVNDIKVQKDSPKKSMLIRLWLSFEHVLVRKYARHLTIVESHLFYSYQDRKIFKI